MSPRLVDDVFADAFRAGLDEERRFLLAAGLNRQMVIDRQRQCEREIELRQAWIQRMRGRIHADTKRLELVPDEGA